MKRAGKWMILIMITLGLAACGSSSSNKSTTDTTGGNDTTAGTDTNSGLDTTTSSDTTSPKDVLILGDLTLPDTSVTADTSQPQTDLSCYRIVACQNKCGTSQACAGACLDNGSTDGKAKYQALGACQTSQCPGLTGTAGAECVATKCTTQSDACLEPVTYGSQTCTQLLSCLVGPPSCANSDGTADIDCLYNCLEKTKEASVQKYNDLEDCGQKNCANETTSQGFQTCVQTNCSTELTACQTDS
ncbi:MAG: hypothetical protein KC609_26145 [Myxococcales bacterium]|nr:hypothetical protein [Myxococcales bacterium]